MNEVIVSKSHNFLLASDDLQNLDEKTLNYISSARADNTNIAYQSDWNNFVLWCHSNSLQSFPASEDTLARYITKLAESKKSFSTIRRKLVAIGRAHEAAKLDNPTKSEAIRLLYQGVARKNGTVQIGKKPLLTEQILQMLTHLPNSTLGIRDKAILLIGFAGAFRRSELVSIRFEDIRLERRALYIHIPKSKTDQTGEGQVIAIELGSHQETCPVQALEDWMSCARITEGYVFRRLRQNGEILKDGLSAQGVARTVKKYAQLCKLNPKEFGGHSLRAGFVTQAAINGADYDSIMKTTRHKKYDTVRKYMRDADLLRNNASARLGL